MYLGYAGILLLLTVSANERNNKIKKYLENYKTNRTELIRRERQLYLGGTMKLDKKEQVANKVFRVAKRVDLQWDFLPSMHFYDAKDMLQNSSLYQLIRKMPKGANLNINALGSVSSDWFVKNLTYMKGFRVCRDSNANNSKVFTFRKIQKSNFKKCKYAEVQRYKKESDMIKKYDENLKKLVDLYASRNSYDILPNDKIWKQFWDMHDRVEDAVYYEPAFRAFHRRMLEELYEDKILYAEVRTQFYKLYDHTSKVYTRADTVETLKQIVEEFKQDHKDFIGVRFIYGIIRHRSKEEVQKEIKEYIKLRDQFPDDILGLDIVGWEDYGYSLHSLIEDFMEIEAMRGNFYFHAGETNLLGDSSDYNLFDANMFYTKRVGKGFALWKHPYILDEFIRYQTPIEICPVSNQIASFVRDLRNHPGGYYIAMNATVVVGSDSPGFLGTTGLSTDLYYTMLCLTSGKGDLKTLKKLILNSIYYSSMEYPEKRKARQIFDEKWRTFINRIIEDHSEYKPNSNNIVHNRYN